MALGPYNRYAPAGAIDRAQYDEGLRQHMLRVYNYMTTGLAVTGLVAFITASTPALFNAIFGTPLQWVVILAPLGFVFFLSARVNTMTAARAQLLFWIFSALMGLSLSTVFVVYTHTSIARVFFITGGMFAATSLYGYTTRRDLAQFGSFLIMGLFGIIIASTVNLFLHSTGLQFAVSVIGVLVFTGLTAFDTQRIKEMYNEQLGADVNQKLAVMGALSLYLNFINIFMFLLQLFGQQRD